MTKIPPYTPPYDTSSFVNSGPFFDTHPDVIPHVTRYESRDLAGNLLESWERDENGVMVNVTARDNTYAELIAAQEALEKLRAKYNI